MAPDPKPVIFRNQLLRALSEEDLALLTPHLTPVRLAPRDEIEQPNRPIKAIVFPESGIVSVVAPGAARSKSRLASSAAKG